MRRNRRLLVAWALSIAVSVAAAYWTATTAERDIRDSQRQAFRQRRADLLRGCERSKRDRTSIARALRAQSDYLNLVLRAQSVKADVKRAATANQEQQDTAARDLETRSGDHFECAAAFR